uniref:group II intron maturase-specific domain-containing protein n=1 Tax=Ureibacillus thermosphaericus TaxID=51173 RepID=UPI000BBC4161|nr:group II intron maturase-specific domain-containing protein [Ureibacillus thermosphaericus]
MLLNQILSRENMLQALKRVEQNKGSHGVDMMPVQNLRQHIVENWLSIKEAILKGTYEPMPVRRVEIPKPDGGVRLLGIPTVRKMPYPMEYRIQKLNQYLMGWCGYFALADTKSIFLGLDKWIRRRLRMCLWKNWKKPKTKIRNLIQLGVPQGQAYEWGNTRKGYWRISNSPILHRTLGNSYWRNQGLKSLEARYENLRQ